MRVFAHATVLSGQSWFVSSHRLVLLPRPLEVHAAVLSALDDRPSTTSTLHVAEHLHDRHNNEWWRVVLHFSGANGPLLDLRLFSRLRDEA